jgi:hypothetical protein
LNISLDGGLPDHVRSRLLDKVSLLAHAPEVARSAKWISDEPGPVHCPQDNGICSTLEEELSEQQEDSPQDCEPDHIHKPEVEAHRGVP